MKKPAHHPRTPARQRGVSLIEALVAFLVTALGMLALAGVQATLRTNSDISKQRSEAVRLAQIDLETARDFSVLPTGGGAGIRAFEDIVPTDPDNAVTLPASDEANATFTLRREVDDDPAEPLKKLRVVVGWTDRTGTAAEVVLDSMIAGVDPQLSGLLSLTPSGLASRNPTGRIINVPLPVHDLEDGRSVFKPAGNGSIAWVFDNGTGFVTSRCSVSVASTTATLNAGDLTSCSTVVGYLLSGYVRFSTGASVDAAAADNPQSPALDVDLQAQPASGGAYATPECADDGATVRGSPTAVRFLCVIYPDQTTRTNIGKWSGRLTAALVDADFGLAATQYRLCRYNADYNGSGAIDNPEHPATYTDVTGNLNNQNFLVIRGDLACPTDAPADAVNNPLDSSTVQHEPPPI